MLAELPLDHPLPGDCAAALAAPNPAEQSLCAAIRGEYAAGVQTMRSIENPGNSDAGPLQRLKGFFLYSAEATNAERAVQLAQMRADAENSRLAEDRPVTEAPEPAGLVRLACFGNFIGCALNGIAAPAYGDYRLRTQDFGAQLELLATLAWLRENAGQPAQLESLLERRPDALKSPTRQVVIGEDGGSLRIRMFDDAHGENRSVPLPAALRR